MSECLLSLREAAEYLGYTEHGLRRIVVRSRRRADGVAVSGPTIRFFQPAKKSTIRFRREWLDEFVARYSVDPEQAPLKAAPEKKEPARKKGKSKFRLDLR